MEKITPIHTRIQNLIKRGELTAAEYVDSYKKIFPALLLHFKNGLTFPVRKEWWNSYKKIINIKIQNNRLNTDLLYFRQFKFPQRANHFFHLIHTSANGQLYYIHTSGVVVVKYKSGIEKIMKGTLRKGNLCVNIDGKTYKIKKLVAREVFNNYSPDCCIVHKDNNPRNCDCYNLKIVTKNYIGQNTGGKTSKAKKVIINGKIYNSIAQAAKSLFVDPQTLTNYLKTGKSKVINKKLNIKIFNGGKSK